MTKVSVIVPIYNVELYLRECLESIVNQTLQDIEIICVNDGSTDNSLSIIHEFALKDSRIKIINKHNTGYGHSMNTGLDHAEGEYIGIVESDDFAALDMYEKLYAAAKRNEAEVIKSNFFEHKGNLDDDQVIENLKGCRYNSLFYPINEIDVFWVLPSTWSGLYKRSFLIKNNIRFPETPGASYQDTSFAFKVWASAERVYLLRDAFLHYRKDNMDSSVNSASKVFCICDEYEEIEKFLESHLSNKKKLASLVFAMKYKSYKWNYKRLAPVFQYAFLLKMAEQFKKAEIQGDINANYFTADEINEVYQILNNSDQFFKDTAKEYRDDRLLLSSTLNLQIYKQGFLTILDQFKGIVIFGAGVIGAKIAEKLVEEKIDNIVCFAVSGQFGYQESLLGFPVYPIDHLSEYADDCVVLVAVKERDQYEIIKNLKSLHFKNIVSIDSNLVNALSQSISDTG